jgi:LruC domain-containing protein
MWLILGIGLLVLWSPWSEKQADASHYRGGILTYKIDPNNSKKVTFTLTTSFRRGYWFSDTTDRTGTLASNAGVSLGTIDFGDGQTANVSTSAVIEDPEASLGANAVISFRATITHTYATAGTKTAFWTSCCWISGAVGTYNTSWRLETNVVLSDSSTNQGPSINSPIYFETCAGVPFQMNMNVTDPESQSLTYTLQYSPNTRDPSVVSQMTIDQLGTVTWPSPQAGMWVIETNVQDSGGANGDMDFLLVVHATCSNQKPVVTLSNTNVNYSLLTGQQLCLDVTGSDFDTAQKLIFTVSPNLNNATAPPGGLQNNPTTWQWCWTPTNSDIGVHTVKFIAKDNHATQKMTGEAIVTLSVSQGNPPTITPSGTTVGDQNTTFNFQVDIADPDGGSITASSLLNLPAWCASTPTGLTQYNISCTPTSGVTPGIYNLRVSATDSGGDRSQKDIPIQVNTTNQPPNTPTLTGSIVSCQNQMSFLASDPNGSHDIAGYILERSTTGTSGPFVPLEGSLITQFSYTDASVVHGTTYYYRVKAQDNSGAQSAYSSVFTLLTNCVPTTRNIIIGYEDAMGHANNDWDYNDFVVHVKSQFQTTTISNVEYVTQINLYVEALARGSSYTHSFHVRVPNLVGTSTVTVNHKTTRSSGSTSSSNTTGSGPVTVTVFEDTKTILPPVGTGTYPFSSNTASSTGSHTNGKYTTITIALDDPSSNPLLSMHQSVFDAYIKMPYLPGTPEVHTEGFCSVCSETVATGVYNQDKFSGTNTQVTGNTMPFTVITPYQQSDYWQWPFESSALWRSFQIASPNEIQNSRSWHRKKRSGSVWSRWTNRPSN